MLDNLGNCFCVPTRAFMWAGQRKLLESQEGGTPPGTAIIKGLFEGMLGEPGHGISGGISNQTACVDHAISASTSGGLASAFPLRLGFGAVHNAQTPKGPTQLL
jgi:hypothetical protein